MSSTAAGAPTLLPDCPSLSDARRRLFESAIALFGERGFHAVSMRDLANELGVAPGAIYAHVTSKQELLYELVAMGLEEHRSRLRRALLDAGADPIDQVRALTRAHVLAHLELPALARVINRELRSLTEEQHAAVLLVRDDSEQTFVDVVARGMRLGAFQVTNARLAVVAIAGMGIRAAEWWTPDNALSADVVVETYADFAIRLLRET